MVEFGIKFFDEVGKGVGSPDFEHPDADVPTEAPHWAGASPQYLTDTELGYRHWNWTPTELDAEKQVGC